MAEKHSTPLSCQSLCQCQTITMSGQNEQQDRLDNEVSLLQAMYPEQITWNAHSRELKYTSDGSNFLLRLPDDYLLSGLPTILSATTKKHDLRDTLKERFHELPRGEEVLDSVVVTFDELAADFDLDDATPEASQRHSKGMENGYGRNDSSQEPRKATILVWLHHLLNTNKRKQALSPASTVSGVTKPGYPGVLLYSGPEAAVREHANELKGLNWAAFQVRMESDEEWKFKHGSGVKEVEGLGEVVAEIGEDRKEEFMEAMRMK